MAPEGQFRSVLWSFKNRTAGGDLRRFADEIAGYFEHDRLLWHRALNPAAGCADLAAFFRTGTGLSDRLSSHFATAGHRGGKSAEQCWLEWRDQVRYYVEFENAPQLADELVEANRKILKSLGANGKVSYLASKQGHVELESPDGFLLDESYAFYGSLWPLPGGETVPRTPRGRPPRERIFVSDVPAGWQEVITEYLSRSTPHEIVFEPDPIDHP